MPAAETRVTGGAARFVMLGGVLSAGGGAVVLSAWIFDVPALQSLLPGLATMKFNTAVCFFLCGTVLWLSPFVRRRGSVAGAPATVRVMRTLALLVALIAGLSLGEELLGWNAGIDELVVLDRATEAAGTRAPGRMSEATAANFLLVAGAIFALTSRAEALIGLGQGLAALSAFLSGIALLGYLLYVPALYAVRPFSTVALHTALTLFVLALALLVARPKRSWMSVWFAETASARMGRQLVAATLVVLPAFGWFAWTGGETQLFPSAFGSMALIAASIAVFAPMIWLATRGASREEEHARRLSRIYQVLSRINALIVRTHDRPQMLDHACRIAVEAGEFPFVWVGLVDEKATRVVPAAWAGDERGFLATAEPRFSLAAPGPVARAVQDGVPVVSNDVRTDPDSPFRDELLAREVRSFAVLPLVTAARTVGVMVVHASVAGFFDDEELKLLRELAGDVAFSLDHIEKEERLNHLAYFNTLTNLANRTLFLDRVGQHVRGAARADGQLALALFDVAGFKAVNDTFGRNQGDELLREIGRRLESHADEPSYFARIEADRFATVIPKADDEHEVVRLCERIGRECFDPPVILDGHEVRLSARTGIALYPRDGGDADSLFHNAEAALKQAKTSGERLLFYAPQINAGRAARLKMESGLRRALEKNEFVLHYQPKVDAETRRVLGLEALLRWQSADLGLVAPARFIPVLEDTGLIFDVGAWVMRQAVADRRRLAAAGLAAPRIAVNVSAMQLRRPDFLDCVTSVLGEDTSPTGLDLELTESVVLHQVEPAIMKLRAIAELGVGIAIDDFGTGYSSLGYLTRLPVQTIKIDRSFIITMGDDPNAMTLISTIISLAHSLRLKVVAEGVETEDQAKFLRLLRCDQLQGYLVCRPMPLQDLLPFLQMNGEPA